MAELSIYSKIVERRQKKLEDKINKAERFQPYFNEGLTDEIVNQRKEDGLRNYKKKVVTKTIFKMIIDNFFPFFNVFIYILGVMVIIAGPEYYGQLMFLGVITCNSIIGLIQDIRARRLVSRLSIINKAQALVVRNSVEIEVLATELVLDDVIILKNGDQVPADCIIIKGKCSANEAMLTGEPDSVKKKVDDILYSGTYVTSGSCYARVDKIGSTNKAEIIQTKASKFSKPKSEILRALNFFLKFIGIIVVILFIGCLLSYYYVYTKDPTINVEGVIHTYDTFWAWFVEPGAGARYISGFVGSMVSMIPAGLFLLTSVALSVGVITLARKRCLVQELYCIEMLARTDVLCLDKTGTITDGTMSVSDLIRIDKTYSLKEIQDCISSLMNATKDENYTAVAIVEKFGNNQVYRSAKVLPFSSETKYSAAYLEKIGTVGLGAYGYIKIDNKSDVDPLIKKYSSKGYRCMIVTTSKGKIDKDRLPKNNTCIAILLLEDHIRDDAPETLAWFANNDVEIKVISGDDPVTVSEIAKKTGIKNFDKYISLEGKSIEETKKLAEQYTIFGRVSPEQKEALVIALKEAKHTVAMTGDGVNDILALKRADCSIAMNSGSDAAKNISHLVLLDSNFSALPSVVAEGRRVINNIQRTSSLFLSKTFFSIIITIISTIAVLISANVSLRFPLSVSNFYIWEIAFIGAGGFLLALEPNSSRLRGTFLQNAIRKALPMAISISVVILCFYVVYMTNYYNHDLWLFGTPNFLTYKISDEGFVGVMRDRLTYNDYNQMLSNSFRAMSAISMAFLGGVAFYKVCLPFTKYRLFVVCFIIVCTFAVLLGAYFIGWQTTGDPSKTTFGGFYFDFEFYWLSLNDWLWMGSFTLLGTYLYLLLDRYINKSAYIEKLEKQVSRLKGESKKFFSVIPGDHKDEK